MSVPRLTRLRPGPGERDITTSISKKTCPRRPQRGETPGEDINQKDLLLSLAGTPRAQGKDSRATQGECLTRGTEPCGTEQGLPQPQPGARSAECTG